MQSITNYSYKEIITDLTGNTYSLEFLVKEEIEEKAATINVEEEKKDLSNINSNLNSKTLLSLNINLLLKKFSINFFFNKEIFFIKMFLCISNI